MTPEELKKMALASSEAEYKQIMEYMKNAAKQGSFSETFNHLSDGAIEQLRNEGFTVTKTPLVKSAIAPTKWGWKVSFAPQQ